jgi:pimeloyl-ACP methyl ester carboxylesterase
MAETIPSARLIELDGGGHMLPETRSEELALEITGFLSAAD